MLRIYNKQYSFDLFDEEIYKKKESEINQSEEVLIQRTANNPNILLHFWRRYLNEYAGYTYCVKELKEDRLIIGGVMKASDIHKLQEYFYNNN